MARRNGSDDLEFGSDSFLDIVANIVGILIILIVIAGVRVSQAPLPTLSVDEDDPAPASPQVALATELPEPERPQPPEAEQPPPPSSTITVEEPITAEPAAPPEPVTPTPPQPPPELVSEAQQIEAELEQFALTGQRLQSALATAEASRQSLSRQLSEAQRIVEQRETETSRGLRTIAELDAEIESKQQHLAELRVRLAETETAAPPTHVLEHHLTPLERIVDGDEIHFHLKAGKVAFVPIDRLADRLKSHLERQSDRLLKVQQHIGTIGPIDGFRMEYTLARIPSSLIDDLRYGQHVIRVGVTQWQLHPEPDLQGEAAEEALAPHSAFLRHLREAGPNATVTFWVYPDGFDLHRQLQEFAHQHGLSVAARPLPEGIPITGSPNGSRSMAQ